MLKEMILCSLLLGSLACRTGPDPLPAAPLVRGRPEHFLLASPAKGLAGTARPGETLITVKDYWAVRTFPKQIRFDRRVTLTTERGIFVIPWGRSLEFSGVVAIDGENLAIYLDAHDDAGLGEMYYVNARMELARFVYLQRGLASRNAMVKILDLAPASCRLVGSFGSDPAAEQVFKMFDLVFNGIDDQGIHVTYRELAPGDPVRVVATEELSFPADSRQIRHGRTELQVRPGPGPALAYAVTAY